MLVNTLTEWQGHVLVERLALIYHFLMTWQEIWGVLKWVLAVLAAGFVGQFGKSLALYFMKRRRNKKAMEPHSLKTEGPINTADKSQEKTEKKKAKAQVKRLKKS